MKTPALFVICLSLCLPVHAQTIDDGIMMTRHNLLIGDVYSHDSWTDYWEGTLKRVNGNIGTITTDTNILSATYGFTSHLTLIGMVPYVWTAPSQGVLQGQQGLQDITIAGKYNVVEKKSPTLGLVRAIAVVYGGFPLTHYTPDFAPLSIGSQSNRLAARGTLNYQTNPGWYADVSLAHTWRGDVMLDRPYYYTNGELSFTNRVIMPDVFDYVVRGGYFKRDLNANVTFSQQRTLGGGDIRRQDMPFVSNRMNFSRVGAMVMYPVPKFRSIQFQLAYSTVVDGRNVGQATTFVGGVQYAYHSRGRSNQ